MYCGVYLTVFTIGIKHMAKRPPVHKPAWLKDKKEERKQYDSKRGTRTERGYNNQWGRARKGWLNVNPLCVAHLAEGRVVAGEVVDHIVPHKGDNKLFWDKTNWQTLCIPCHNSKTARENGIQSNIR